MSEKCSLLWLEKMSCRFWTPSLSALMFGGIPLHTFAGKVSQLIFQFLQIAAMREKQTSWFSTTWMSLPTSNVKFPNVLAAGGLYFL